MMEGFFSTANLNKALIYFSDSPTYLDIKSDELTEKKVPSHSVAQALARKVLPVPGGPYKRIPFQGFLFPSNNSGNLTGRITASLRASIAFFNPAISDHLTFGLSDTTYDNKLFFIFSLSLSSLSLV